MNHRSATPYVQHQRNVSVSWSLAIYSNKALALWWSLGRVAFSFPSLQFPLPEVLLLVYKFDTLLLLLLCP